ncbi:MAG: response regulator transcription factor [Candidatus Pseudomonas phytovorans]|uniref:Response regulator transcription factor n=1 Tax=Candidatus Pseudomonas phytovorans TaxID=3121377 RepID=A0AAJ6BBT6_9PSED|nr:response regulator transcription factor [Pseudomonas sp.]WEK31850.1 MAG: response regulator transcription factor [Pseudomonas sp.]
MSTLTIMLVDSHALFRQGLAALLAPQDKLQVIAQLGDPEQLLTALAFHQPQLLIIDPLIATRPYADIVLRVHRRFPDTRILCISSTAEPHQVNAALDAGASGYLLKDSGIEECLKAIQQSARGQVYLGAELATALALSQRAAPAMGKPLLSQRERQVLLLLAEGFSSREIAERLHIGSKTVSTHREHIMHKLGLKGIAQLTRYALNEGWLKS